MELIVFDVKMEFILFDFKIEFIVFDLKMEFIVIDLNMELIVFDVKMEFIVFDVKMESIVFHVKMESIVILFVASPIGGCLCAYTHGSHTLTLKGSKQHYENDCYHPSDLMITQINKNVND